MFSSYLGSFQLRFLFEAECDAIGVGISAILTQGECLLTFFNEKLNGSRLNRFTYDKEFYVIVRALEHLESLLQAQALSTPFRP